MLWAMGFLVHDFGQFHAEHKIGPNTWPHFDLLWIYSGRVTIQLGRKEPLELNGGDGVLIYPNTPFQGKALTDTAFASAQHFDFDRSKELPPTLQRLRAKKGGYRVYRGFSHNPVVADIERAIHLASKPQNKAMRELRWLNLAMILNQLESTSVVDQAAPEGREKLTAWRQAFRKTPLLKATVSELAARLDLTSQALRLFLRQHGMTPRRFLLEIRMQHARHLLSGTPQPIKEIAVECGYADVVAFHRAFTGYFSETPANYRERHRQLFTG
jgi:AraC-like DNA-binding protein